MSNGGTFTTVWGAYLYISRAAYLSTPARILCQAFYPTPDVASINADGSIDTWNAIGTLATSALGQSLLAWRNYLSCRWLYGCKIPTTGACGQHQPMPFRTARSIKMAMRAQLARQFANGTAPCSGASPSGLQSTGYHLHRQYTLVSFITNGYLYLIGGCTNNTCSTTPQHNRLCCDFLYRHDE